MAVFTPVTPDQARAFIADYGLGALSEIAPIAEGVENTNYRIETAGGRHVLTLFERRTDEAGLPFCLGLTDHLADAGFPAPRPVRGVSGDWIGRLNGRPAAVIQWLQGAGLQTPTAAQATAGGRLLADLHLKAADFAGRRANPVGPVQWRLLAEKCDHRAAGDSRRMLEALVAELDRLEPQLPGGLPSGPIHADYFPDNVLFEGDRPGGVIDFYFAHVGAWTYDLAIALNAWGFDAEGRPDEAVLTAFLRGYEQGRRLERAEVEALPLLGAASAVRFTLTRLHDQLFHDPDWLVTPKDPAPFFARIAFHRAASPADYGLAAA
ncbi:MAG: homoserine kinase [Brevundimonas sp.]